MKITLLSTLIIAAAIVAWHYQSPPEPQKPTLASSNPVTRLSSTTSAPVAQLEPAAQAAPAFHPEADEVPYDIVHGIKVRKDRNCTVEVEYRFDPETGNTRKIFSCIPNSPREIDPYTTYDSNVLAGMAYGDAHAAEVLGVRLLRSPDSEVENIGLQYLLRAVALSNDPLGIKRAVNNRYNSFRSDDTYDLENIKRLVTLSHIANKVSPGTMSGPAYQKILRDFGVSEAEIEALISNGDEILEHMAVVQTEVTGNTYIREALDDA